MHISLGLSRANKKQTTTTKFTKKQKKCFGSYTVVLFVSYINIFGLYDLECIFMAIGLGYRHQHRGNFCVPKI